jgi:hypothetical protein
MFERELSVYRRSSVSPIILPRATGYIGTLNTNRRRVSTRYEQAFGRETLGVVMLRHLLSIGDPDWLLSRYPDSDLDRYFQGILPRQKDLHRPIDQTSTGSVATDHFIKNQGSGRCAEFIIPVTEQDPLKILPFDKGWDTWKKMRAVRLLDIDSTELTFNTHQDLIVFRDDMPSRAVIAVNPALLVMQYTKYLETIGKDKDHTETIPVYLHRYVLNDGLLLDLQNLWLRERYVQMLKYPDGRAFDASDINASIYHNIYGYLGSQYTSGMEEIHSKLVIPTLKRSVTPDRVIHSLPMAHSYVPQVFSEVQAACDIPNERQYYWTEYLRDMTWLRLYYYATLLAPDHSMSKSFHVVFRRTVDLLIKTRFWSAIPNGQVRKDIEKAFREVIEWTGATEMLDAFDQACSEM